MQRRVGYSLPEVMVSVAVLGIMCAVAIPNIGSHLHVVVAVVIVLSVIPIVIEVLKERKRRSA